MNVCRYYVYNSILCAWYNYKLWYIKTNNQYKSVHLLIELRIGYDIIRYNIIIQNLTMQGIKYHVSQTLYGTNNCIYFNNINSIVQVI